MEFTHFDEAGNALMVDVSDKKETVRQAKAVGYLTMSPLCFEKVQTGGIKKGDVLNVARIAGIMGVKKTSELIPLCHVLLLTKVTIDFALLEKTHQIKVTCIVKTTGKTGVEMEALTGVNIALLTIYDMCKALDKKMVISNIHLSEKTGGKSGHFVYGGDGND